MPDLGQMRVFHAERKRIPKTEDSLAERAGFELTGDFCSRSVRHMNTSNRRCQQDIMDISWKAFAKRFVSSAIPKAAM
jgi:hypothetical protein